MIAGGSEKKAIAMTNKLIEVSPLDGYQMQLRNHRKDKNKEKELETASILSEKFAQHPQALLNAGFSYQLHKNYSKALKLFESASKLKSSEEDDSPVSALYQIGKTADISEQQTELGIQSLELYLTKQLTPAMPNKNWARFRLASLYQQKGEKKKAKNFAELAGKEKSDKELKKRVKKLLKKLN